jgi:hypothetical protein
VTIVAFSAIPLVIHDVLRGVLEGPGWASWGWVFLMPFYGLVVLAFVVFRVLK